MAKKKTKKVVLKELADGNEYQIAIKQLCNESSRRLTKEIDDMVMKELLGDNCR
ncbi:hypothetical protein [Candidatus Magnetobacterium casense]|uniref:Uncharacterized protein n=1 Tax=Candidatus Magnetobacterium casense TaxID=1455061 RepID=A0ABS6RUZ6_9BACT|nr:hypothetical protein [Candidatus Magnetobacterium casensis]MBV6340456.1 hypothetical protein [Candidatus Magnetobacterium casensis]